MYKLMSISMINIYWKFIFFFFFWLVFYYDKFLIMPLHAVLLNRLEGECFRAVVLNCVAHLEMTQGFLS